MYLLFYLASLYLHKNLYLFVIFLEDHIVKYQRYFRLHLVEDSSLHMLSLETVTDEIKKALGVGHRLRSIALLPVLCSAMAGRRSRSVAQCAAAHSSRLCHHGRHHAPYVGRWSSLCQPSGHVRKKPISNATLQNFSF